VKAAGDAEAEAMLIVHEFRTTFDAHGCEILGIAQHMADRILNHVATATRPKIMRVHNKSEIFESRRDLLAAWAKLIDDGVIKPTQGSGIIHI
jgi:hypothetical protein